MALPFHITSATCADGTWKFTLQSMCHLALSSWSVSSGGSTIQMCHVEVVLLDRVIHDGFMESKAHIGAGHVSPAEVEPDVVQWSSSWLHEK